MKNFFSLLIHFKFKELLILPTDDGFIQFFRFIFVGGFATLVDIFAGWVFVTFVFKSDFSIGSLVIKRDVISVAIGFIFGLVANYFLSIMWIFRVKNINRVFEFLSFAVIGIIGLFIKSGVVYLLGLFIKQQDGFPFLIKSAIGTIIAFIWNFTARKFILYRNKETKKEQIQ